MSASRKTRTPASPKPKSATKPKTAPRNAKAATRAHPAAKASPTAKPKATPHAATTPTRASAINAVILREIKIRGAAARFRKVGGVLFEAGKCAASNAKRSPRITPSDNPDHRSGLSR